MKRLATGTTALALGALLASGPLAAQQRPAPGTGAGGQDTRPGIAVLDFEIGATIGQDPEDYQALRRGLAALTTTELTANRAIRVVERAQLQQILQEQNLGREGRVDPSTVVNIGRLVGARYMVTGTLLDNRGDLRIDARIFDTETSQIIGTQSARGNMNRVFELVEGLARQLMQGANLPPLERRAMEEHRQQNPAPPSQAVMAYSRAVLYADRGETQRAVEQYRRALQAFPQYTQARADCNRLQQGACG
jgi:curli biogenesis system outer membrane secretion channel CsgG